MSNVYQRPRGADEICRELHRLFDELYALSEECRRRGDSKLRLKCYRAMEQIEDAMIVLGGLPA